jgi:hypothetical protein
MNVSASQTANTVGRTTPTAQAARMVRGAVSHGEFFASFDVAQGIKGNAPLLHLQHHIGRAGMVGKTQWVGGVCGIHGTFVGDGHHEDAARAELGLPGAGSGRGHVNELATNLAYLAPSGNGLMCEGTLPINGAGCHINAKLLRVCGLAGRADRRRIWCRWHWIGSRS